VTWPVEGGEWYVSQGYNGSSHQNNTQYWQYYYSFDLKRSDGNTAGQPVYSAVSGTIRWIDESTGGMSIYMGNGLAYAYFHTRIDPSLQEGDTVTQGQYMGTIAPAGEAGSGSSAHLHITVWATEDEGNWSRNAIPFTGAVAIEGIAFPATGTGNDYRGYTFNP
jgi:murein DD-endopeptidase MepM/ murein hydrolase activator NlpD